MRGVQSRHRSDAAQAQPAQQPIAANLISAAVKREKSYICYLKFSGLSFVDRLWVSYSFFLSSSSSSTVTVVLRDVYCGS